MRKKDNAFANDNSIADATATAAVAENGNIFSFNKPLESIGVCGFFKNKLAVKTAKNCIKLAEQNNISISVSDDFPVGKNLKNLLDFDVDLCFVFGGDGSLLHVFRALGEKQLPLMGINCGEIGYFMDIDSGNFDKKIPMVFQGNFVIEKRTRLEGILDGVKLPFALNEFVITATKSATIMRYSLKIDSEFLWKDSADGIIVSTPTGSTAYSLSARGPVVLFNTNVLLVNPINSVYHMNHLAVNEDSKINIFNINASSPCELVVDGQERFKAKNEVEIKKSGSNAFLARLFDSKFAYFKKRSYSAEFERKSLNELKNLSPSAKFIVKVLELEKSLTQKEIINITQLPQRTVRRALEQLIKSNIITKRPFISDPRQDIYILTKSQ